MSDLSKNSVFDEINLFFKVGKLSFDLISYPKALILFFKKTSNIGSPIVPHPAIPIFNFRIIFKKQSK